MALPKRALTPENTAAPIIPEETAQAFRNLNFKVPPEFRKRFTVRAALDDCSQVELLQRAFEAYEQLHGGQ